MPLLTHRYGGGAPERMGLKHTFIAPYGAFGCGDGGQVLLSVQSDRAARIANARLNSVADLSEHPNLRNAATQFGGMPVSMADLPLGDGAEPLLDAPKLGADTAAIRAEFASGQKKGPAD